MIRSFTLIFAMAIFIACSPQVHKDFELNRYVKNQNTHLINDSLQLYLKSPADFTYATDRKGLSRIIRKEKGHYKNVIVYGKTNLDPYYEYFLLIDSPATPKQVAQENTIVLDTILNNHKISLVGRNLDTNTTAFQNDLRRVFKSIELGTGYRKSIVTVMDIVAKYDGSNRFIEAHEELKNFPAYDKEEDWLKLQMQLTFASFLGNLPDYNELIKKFEPERSQDTISHKITQNLIPSAQLLDEIMAKADQTNLVMVNENHFMPQHRQFVYSLLPALQKLGYRYLALEALINKQDSLLNLDNGFPTVKSGFYIREQHFANLLRYAKSLGYEFVAYESDGSMEREQSQAHNLYSKTFGVDKNAKVLLLGGIDHILEQPTASGKKWLGAILHEKYNIDPLTISQTHLNSYRKFSKEEISLVEGKHFAGKLKAVDYHLLNNISLTEEKKGTNYSYSNKFSFPVQFTLFLAEEAEDEYDLNDKIPSHAFHLKPYEKVALKLTSKTYYMVLFDANGKTVHREAVNIMDQAIE